MIDVYMIKKILLCGAIIVAGATSLYVVFVASEVGGAYVVELIRDEQHDHYRKMNHNVVALAHAHARMQTSVDKMIRTRLTQDDKELIREDLRQMEEIGLNMSRETFFYNEDTTVHLFFAPEAYVVTYFDQTRNTPLYIERFVRVMEQGLFAQYLTREQKETIAQNYALLSEELERAK